MKIQRLLPKSMRRHPVVRAMPMWTSEPESTEWFDTFNLDGEELIGFVPEPQKDEEKKMREEKVKQEKKRQEKIARKTVNKTETPKPTEMGFVVVDGKQHVIALGTPATYQILVVGEAQTHVLKENEKEQKRQHMTAESRALHLKRLVELMQRRFLSSTGRLLIAELVVAGPGNTKDALIKLLPQSLAKVASSAVTSQAGKGGLWELVHDMLAQEYKQERERLGLNPKKYKPGVQMPTAQYQHAGKSQVAKHLQASKQPATQSKGQCKKGKKRCN